MWSHLPSLLTFLSLWTCFSSLLCHFWVSYRLIFYLFEIFFCGCSFFVMLALFVVGFPLCGPFMCLCGRYLAFKLVCISFSAVFCICYLLNLQLLPLIIIFLLLYGAASIFIPNNVIMLSSESPRNHSVSVDSFFSSPYFACLCCCSASLRSFFPSFHWIFVPPFLSPYTISLRLFHLLLLVFPVSLLLFRLLRHLRHPSMNLAQKQALCGLGLSWREGGKKKSCGVIFLTWPCLWLCDWWWNDLKDEGETKRDRDLEGQREKRQKTQRERQRQ